MGYLFLGIALLAGATKGYCGKRTSGYVEGYSGAMLANLIRMLFCIIIGLGMVAVGGNWSTLAPNASLLAISAISGIGTSAFVVSWLLSVKKGAYMMLDVFLMLGVLVPICGGSIFFHEAIEAKQWIGIALLVVAAFVMCSYNNTIKEKMSLQSFLLLVFCGTVNGITDFMQKVFVKKLPDTPASVYNLYIYVFSAITLAVFFFIFRSRDRKNGKDTEIAGIKRMVGYILVMSVCLFANSFFKTKAAFYLDSVQMFPLNQGLSLTLSMVMATTLFHEKMNLKCVVGILLAFAGILIINVL